MRVAARNVVTRCGLLAVAVLLVTASSAAGAPLAVSAAATTPRTSIRFVDSRGDVERHASDLLAVSVVASGTRVRVTAEVAGPGPADEFTFSFVDRQGGYTYANAEHAGGESGQYPGCVTSYVRRDARPVTRMRLAVEFSCVRGVDLSGVRLTVRLLRGPVYPDPAYELLDVLVTPWFALAP